MDSLNCFKYRKKTKKYHILKETAVLSQNTVKIQQNTVSSKIKSKTLKAIQLFS